MKATRMLLVAGAALCLAGFASPACAESYDTDDSDHPIRYAAYAVHAVGKGIETVVARPIHWFVSKPKMRYVFGKTSQPRTDDYTGDADLYQRYSY